MYTNLSTGLPQGQEKWQMSGKNWGFWKKSGNLTKFWKTSDFFSLNLPNSLYSKAFESKKINKNPLKSDYYWKIFLLKYWTTTLLEQVVFVYI